ncbi:unnamed protein product [Mucor fragilis]
MSSIDIKKALVASIAESIDTTKTETVIVVAIEKLEDAIVQLYQGEDYDVYKRAWISAIVECYQDAGIQLGIKKSKKPNWEIISTLIIGRLAKYVYPNAQVASISPAQSTSSGVSSSRRSSTVQSSDGQTSASQTSATIEPNADPCVKIPKLYEVDKENVRLLYDRLDKNKMWRLSNGTIVEEKMREFALQRDHEHPSHSLILDVSDKCWLNIFQESEMDEIRRFRSVQKPLLSLEVETYFKELEDLDSEELFNKVDLGDYDVKSDLGWLQKSYRDTYRLLHSDFFPITSETEANVMRRVWSPLDTSFDFCQIKCVSGEKCSKASADAANQTRCLSDVGRQSSGRKMDYLFTTRKTGFEVGCGECALVGGVQTTKELVDAGFKMPKVMRDMANSIFSKKIALVNDLTIVGFYVAGNII